MTSVINFQVLYGTNSGEPLCSILQIDDRTLLLDCGWEFSFDTTILEPLKEWIDKIDAVLISHADLAHLGALPYAVRKLGLTAPIFVTIPVNKFGQMLFYDLYQSLHSSRDFSIFSLDDIDYVFDQMKLLKYSQHVQIGEDIDISAHAAGHLCGGSIWSIKKESEEIVYAVNTNHRMERHLGPGVLSSFSRPSLLITNTENTQSQAQDFKNRDNIFFEKILTSLRAGGDVLIPVDTSGRVLELLVFMDAYWTKHKLSSYGLGFVSHCAYQTMEFARSQLEWMSPKIVQRFQEARDNAFVFKTVRTLHNSRELSQVPSPRVILATHEQLEFGFARELFIDVASQANGLVLFAQTCAPGTLSYELAKEDPPRKIKLVMKKRVDLEGEELDDYYRRKEEEEERKLIEEEEGKKSKMEIEGEEVLDESSEEEDDMDEATAARHAFSEGPDMTAEQFLKMRIPVRFPCVERNVQSDEYGEALLPSDFLAEDSSSLLVRAPLSSLGGTDASGADMEVTADGVSEITEKPTKIVEEIKEVTINCKLLNLPFDGVSDINSLCKIISQMAPRKMILVNGTQEEKDTVASKLPSSLSLYRPQRGEAVNVTADTNLFKVKLADTLYSSLSFRSVGEYQLAKIEGLIVPSTQANDSALSSIHPTSDLPVLDPLPLSAAETAPDASSLSLSVSSAPTLYSRGLSTVYVGDVKLASLRETLQQGGLQADFGQGGTLVTGKGNILVRKEGAEGKSIVRIEGVLTPDYFAVREAVYKQLTFL